VHDVRHSYGTAGRDAKIDWKALGIRLGRADIAFAVKQYVQNELEEADRPVAQTLAELMIGGAIASVLVTRMAAPRPPDDDRTLGPRRWNLIHLLKTILRLPCALDSLQFVRREGRCAW
jgi:hypothetical protein